MGTDTPKYRNEPESGGHSSSCQNPLVFARRFGFPAFWVTAFPAGKDTSCPRCSADTSKEEGAS